MADILVIANRGQYNHRIYRTLKYLGVNVKFVKNDITVEEVEKEEPRGLVIGGGPFLDETGNSSEIIKAFSERVPILGICLGQQLLAKVYGGRIRVAEYGEYAESEIIVDFEDTILKGLKPSFNAWVSHKDEVAELPEVFEVLAHSESCKVEAIAHKRLPLYGVQFHPEVEHTPRGVEVFKNFLKVCSLNIE